MCENRWRKCDETEIHLDIVIQGKRLAICEGCWRRISKSNRQWRNP